MEASAIHAPAALGRFPLGGGLLRLRSDEQLIAAFRSGNDEAFRILHDRYRQRLFAYVRQMLSSCSRQDAEDVLQDVFVRAYGALRNDNREMNVRAWLYRVAHNRCIDHLRRPIPPAAEIFEVSRKPLHDPVEEAQRRDDLRQLVADVGQLPEQQRSALLMREIDGMTYADLANALDVTVPAVKSLLVRARVGLVEAAEARDADCVEIQADLLRAYDRGVKASGRARKHMRSCDGCTEYRSALRGMRRSFAALTPIGVGPLAFAAKLIGLGGSGAAAAGGGSAAVAGGGAAATATACKVAAVVCTAALATGGAVEVNHKIQQRAPAPVPAKTAKTHSARTAPAAAPVVARAGGKPQVVTFAPSRPAKAAPAAKPEHKTATSQAQAEGRRRGPDRARRTTRCPRSPTIRRPRPAAPALPTRPPSRRWSRPLRPRPSLPSPTRPSRRPRPPRRGPSRAPRRRRPAAASKPRRRPTPRPPPAG